MLGRERPTQDERGGAAGEDPPPPAGGPQGEEERPEHPRRQPGEHAVPQPLLHQREPRSQPAGTAARPESRWLKAEKKKKKTLSKTVSRTSPSFCGGRR